MRKETEKNIFSVIKSDESVAPCWDMIWGVFDRINEQPQQFWIIKMGQVCVRSNFFSQMSGHLHFTNYGEGCWEGKCRTYLFLFQYIKLWRQEHGNQFPYNLINVLQKTFHRFEELVSLGRNVTLLCMCPFTAGAETRFHPLQMIFLVIVWFLQSVRSCWPNVFCEWNIICEIWWHQWIVNR